MIMVLILIGVVVGMMQCASKTLHKKKPRLQENGRAPMPVLYLAGQTQPADPMALACVGGKAS